MIKHMIMNQVAKLLILLTPALFTACEEMVTEIDLPGADPKLVVNSYLSPEDSILVVTVRNSRPVSQSMQIHDIRDALVTFTSAQGSVVPVFDSVRGCFVLPPGSMQVLPGNTYSIAVEREGYKPASASTTIPLQANQSVEFTGITRKYDYEQELFMNFLNFRITDLPGEENYYYARCMISYEWDSLNWYELYADRGEMYLSDQGHDGEHLYFSFGTWDENIHSARFLLYTTDEAYYRFHKTLYNFTGDDPFSEPVIVYTNVTNGLGAVGSYRVFERIVYP